MNQDHKIRKRGVFLLPNALTTGALFAGFYSIIAGINGQYAAAAIAVVVAGLLDGLDGRVARMTNTQSEFGLEYDSLSDLVSFGLAPALLAFNWSLRSLGELSPFAGKLGWLAAFFFVACAALRLARFNTQAEHDDRSYFQGLASPAAAGTLVVTIWFFVDHDVAGSTVRWLIMLETIALGLLMFSRVRYYSFKNWPRGERVPIAWLFVLVLIFVLLALDPPTVMMVLGLTYVFSGLAITFIGRRTRQQRRMLRIWKRRREKVVVEDDAEDGE
ncbi:MAG: CDP-diacylglycerol--serine O-phosphatidyltransferase [Xanthomonadales bacterium]|nr:CDP-diacylglycerol--serine O-phosphatidyltransferase [Xanthomonadales bacterium]NIX14116.1 CDP-diacylglycerol--serine O-phosphatidyltransferase [Xanthomonadales bacterium]